MNIQNQVLDLNFLTEAASPSPSAMNGQRQSSSAESPAVTNESGNKKRPSDDAGSGGNAQTRAKRNRYISIACNECKRRKIKCNGNTPCQRCGNLNLQCQYAPNCCTNGFKESEEFRQMNAHLTSLQEQVNNLYANLNALRSGGDNVAFTPETEPVPQTSHSSISPRVQFRPAPKHATFRGPTSSAFGLDVAKNTLHTMGYQGMGDEGVGTQDPTPVGSPPPALSQANGDPRRDPIWALSKDEMVRLCRVYEEEIGMLYPVLDIEDLIVHGKTLYDFVGAAMRNGLINLSAPGQGVNDEQSHILKMVLAISTVVEGSGQSDVGYRLFESVREAADRMLHSGAIQIKSLPFMVLVAIYHFHCDEEALAWRIIGQVARMCIELGLHRRDSLFKIVKEEKERASVIRLFWSIYVLDRRWSFGTGMPFALQDADIDASLPEPVMAIPYLNAMIAYSRIGSKVWRSISSYTPNFNPALNIEEIGFLDYQVLQWQKGIPEGLKLPTAASTPTASTRAIHRLQILLYLRANQMRMLIYRPVLHSASSIQDHLETARTVVELAKDTIRALTHLNQTTDIYRVQQVCFNYFLISALAVIFLASCHAPVHFSAMCRDEFYMALDLVKGFSNKSWVSKRLWKTIKNLREVGPKLGLSQEGMNGTSSDMEDPHSSAALAMAGLAGHEISGMGNFAQDGTGAGSSNSPMNGYQMSHEMTNLFEAALNVGMNGANGYSQVQDGDSLAGVGGNFPGGDEGLYWQLKDLF